MDVIQKDKISRDDMYIIIPLAVHNEIIEELEKKVLNHVAITSIQNILFKRH